MKRQIIVKAFAISDMDAMYWQGVELWGRRQARIYLEDLASLFSLLAAQPEIARERPEFRPPVRIYPFRSHMVIYQFTATELDILRVVHGRTNWAAILNS
ncbi:type II toxin-antitoxin system RelE/ParE family toxin [Tabrizicola sp.]|uniref:type II toxin-antitoxin system RelE/ParE family toxin n=1 Tax=Tabrizicola sp. TaxID=2005166 RepID=UPI001A60CBC5|nr:type II toxin-antitoxin system RelE/ParE family toxin [Tabrizicola sp.]MBL9074371.1 type II toxin-antitoxin system RelE/ParE family toxin [Tabrizicola sp.]